MAVLFLNTRVNPVTQSGESMEKARSRIMDLIANDSGHVLLLQLLHPERAPLVWTRQ